MLVGDTVSCPRKLSKQCFRCETSKSLSCGHPLVAAVFLVQRCERVTGDAGDHGAGDVALGHDADRGTEASQRRPDGPAAEFGGRLATR